MLYKSIYSFRNKLYSICFNFYDYFLYYYCKKICISEKVNNYFIAFIAKISYPLYLTHQFIGFVIINKLEKLGFINEFYILIPIAISIGIAYLINKAELGKLDNENSTRCSIYLAPKKYAFIDLEEKENGKNIDGDLIIKCGGLPDKAKEKITTIENFYYGYETNCKLQRKFIKGGIDLAETKFRILKPKESVYNCLDVIGV